VCVLTAMEPCNSFDIQRNREKKELELVKQRSVLRIETTTIVGGPLHQAAERTGRGRVPA
jgi:hypothetical protein